MACRLLQRAQVRPMTLVEKLVLLVTLVSAPIVARPTEDGRELGVWTTPPPYSQTEVPPAAPAQTPGPPPAQAQAPATQSAPPGQWVYRGQDGWVWMPYGGSYTDAPTDGGEPDERETFPAYSPTEPSSAAPPQTPWPSPAEAQAPASQPAPGQWVYTDQYGWIYMPYGSGYTYAPADGGGEPSMYVYGTTGGWRWVVAPWLWGWGPVPYFGVHGGSHFAWYGHGWGPGWRGFRPAPFRNGFAQHGVAPAPLRRSFTDRSAPVHRGGVADQGGGAFRGGTFSRGGVADRGGGSFRGGAFSRGGVAERGGGAYRGGAFSRGGSVGRGGFAYRGGGSAPRDGSGGRGSFGRSSGRGHAGGRHR